MHLSCGARVAGQLFNFRHIWDTLAELETLLKTHGNCCGGLRAFYADCIRDSSAERRPRYTRALLGAYPSVDRVAQLCGIECAREGHGPFALGLVGSSRLQVLLPHEYGASLLLEAACLVFYRDSSHEMVRSVLEHDDSLHLAQVIDLHDLEAGMDLVFDVTDSFDCLLFLCMQV